VGLIARLDAVDRRFLGHPGERRAEQRRKFVERSLLRTVSPLATWLVVMAAVLLVITITNEREDAQLVAKLRLDGATAQGTAVGFGVRQDNLIWPDEVRVVFQTPSGETVKVWVPTRHLPDKGPVTVRYVRGNPHVARLAGDETPHRGHWVVVAVAAPSVLVVFVGVLAIAVVHVTDDIVGKWHENRSAAWLYLALVTACLVVAERLIRAGDDPHARDLKWWLAAGLIAGATAAGFVLSRTVGFPGDHGADKGSWAEPLGLNSLLIEGIVVLLVLGHVTERRRR